MRISDWSSDVCSSDLAAPDLAEKGAGVDRERQGRTDPGVDRQPEDRQAEEEDEQDAQQRCALDQVDIGPGEQPQRREARDRKSVVSGKSVSVRVDLGGGRTIKKKKKESHKDEK